MPSNYILSHPSYLFFNTYPGFILQVLPLALLAGFFALWRDSSRRPGETVGRKVLRFLFACYLAGLLSLTLIPQNLMGEIWYRIFYGTAGSWDAERFLRFGGINLIPDFFVRFRAESLANIVLFLPFGVLEAIRRPALRWKTVVLRGLALSFCIEVLQPFLGRSFDTNDLILNTIGAAIGAGFVFLLRWLKRRLSHPTYR